jgi:hypothetical protein
MERESMTLWDVTWVPASIRALLLLLSVVDGMKSSVACQEFSVYLYSFW